MLSLTLALAHNPGWPYGLALALSLALASLTWLLALA
jgi:hypothetical protein